MTPFPDTLGFIIIVPEPIRINSGVQKITLGIPPLITAVSTSTDPSRHVIATAQDTLPTANLAKSHTTVRVVKGRRLPGGPFALTVLHVAVLRYAANPARRSTAAQIDIVDPCAPFLGHSRPYPAAQWRLATPPKPLAWKPLRPISSLAGSHEVEPRVSRGTFPPPLILRLDCLDNDDTALAKVAELCRENLPNTAPIKFPDSAVTSAAESKEVQKMAHSTTSNFVQIGR
ncbi:hypothetical protein B0H14DRAFT_2569273 [Mycena olivaceomarginata]|nr:hypothetical protein B0H14DRAFT_2569273 [Mycena olivaceomarginata]